jgi:hypothetical protein
LKMLVAVGMEPLMEPSGLRSSSTQAIGSFATRSGAVLNRRDREQEDPRRCQSESSRTRL